MNKKQDIQTLKDGFDLARFCEDRGLTFTQSGKDRKARCPLPDHEDADASFTVSGHLWNCFGCGRGGSIIDLLVAWDQLSEKQAIAWLIANANSGQLRQGSALSATPAKEEGSDRHRPQPNQERRTTNQELVTLPEGRAQQLLNRVVEIYQQRFGENDIGRRYLEARAITDAGLFGQHRIGWAAGNLRRGVAQARPHHRGTQSPRPAAQKRPGTLRGLRRGAGVRAGRGDPHPLRPGDQGGGGQASCVSVRTQEEPLEPGRGPARAVVDRGGVDLRCALGAGRGQANVVALQGKTLAEEDLAWLRQQGVNRLTLMLDGDDSGQKAARNLAAKLDEAGLNAEIVELPDGHDPNSFLIKEGAPALAALLVSSTTQTENFKLPTENSHGVELLDDGFAITLGLRRYQILGLQSSARKLRPRSGSNTAASCTWTRSTSTTRGNAAS